MSSRLRRRIGVARSCPAPPPERRLSSGSGPGSTRRSNSRPRRCCALAVAERSSGSPGRSSPVGCYACADLYWYAVLEALPAIPYPSLADALLSGVLPGGLCRASCCCCGRAAGASRRASGWTGRSARSAWRGRRRRLVFPVVLDTTGGATTTVVTNIAYPIVDLALLGLVVVRDRADGLAAGRPGAPARGRLRAVRGGRHDLPLPDRRGTYATARWLDLGWPAALRARRCSPPARLPSAPRAAPFVRWPALVVPAVFGAVALGLLVYDHFERLDTVALLLARGRRGARDPAARADVRGVPARARAQPARRRVSDAAHRPRQPPRADAATSSALAARRPGAPAAAGPLRPRRLQDLQRHVRPSRRRRAARSGSAHLRSRRSAGTADGLPHGRRRVLPARAAGDRHRADARRSRARRRRAQRARRALRDRRARTAWSCCPTRRRTATDALRLADQRMYAQQGCRPPSRAASRRRRAAAGAARARRRA